MAELHEDGKVTVTNVPSYRYKANVAVDVAGYGTVVGDIGWGGNWFFLVDQSQEVPEVIPQNIKALTEFSSAISISLAEQGITGEDGMPIDHVEVFGEPTPGVSDGRGFVLCPGLAYDRSPCGTGFSAKLACLFADGKLQPGQIWRQAGILNTVFEGRVEDLENGSITPIISGMAYISGEATLILQDQDPFRYGIVSLTNA
jgi:4-hydroxyproline epimerase